MMLGTLLGLLCAMHEMGEPKPGQLWPAFEETLAGCAVVAAIDPQAVGKDFLPATAPFRMLPDYRGDGQPARHAQGPERFYAVRVWREPWPGECPGFGTVREWWMVFCGPGWIGLPSCRAVGAATHECDGACADCG